MLHTTPLSHMPSPLPRQNRWVPTSFSFPNSGGLPRNEGGSASALPFSRPAQRSLHVTAYTLAESLTDPFTPECFSRFVTSTTVPIATGWNDPCRVGFAPTEVVHLCTAHFISAGYESLFPGSSRSRFTLTVPSRALCDQNRGFASQDAGCDRTLDIGGLDCIAIAAYIGGTS